MPYAPPAPARIGGLPAPCKTGIAERIGFLSLPQSYPDGTTRVETVETHYSWVFLTDAYAFKLKKPVRGDGFDFRTIAARRRNALAEIRLNRRLAGDVYIGVVPLTGDAQGRLAIGGRGAPIDWLVKMVRLDSRRMLDRRIASGRWRGGDIEPVASRLAAFYATAPRVRLIAPIFTARMKAEIAAAERAFSAAADPQLVAALKPITRRIVAFLARRTALLRRRVHDRRLVDGHGDLRPEHVYVNGTPRIIDCLEFRADLRQVDPVGELAYLALECRRLGGPPIGHPLLRRYRERTGDAPPDQLVRFYAALSAVVRARIAIRHVRDPGAHAPAELRDRAAAYLAIAAHESAFLSRSLDRAAIGRR